MENYISLKAKLDGKGTVVRYRDLVVTTELKTGPHGEWFTAAIWEPIETEEETGIDFFHLRLENATPWEPESPYARFDTEGEAMYDAMQVVAGLTI